MTTTDQKGTIMGNGATLDVKHDHLTTGDRVTDAYALRVTGTVTETGSAMDWRGDIIATATVQWDRQTDPGTYSQETLVWIGRAVMGEPLQP